MEQDDGVGPEQGQAAADLVVDATGRRSAIDLWLQAAGARRSWTAQAECGLAYYSRHYRFRPDAALPGPETTRVVLALSEFTTKLPMTVGGWPNCATPCSARQRPERHHWKIA
jgi:hypothetical protein